jgi:oligopeptide/dipeptide ABC transporter ATP-binding protein
MADRIVVMYAGKIMEIGDRASVFGAPLHPYTEALFSAAVLVTDGNRPAMVLDGDPPSTITPPAGCRFNTRCPHAGPLCFVEEPSFVKLSAAHEAACHLLTGKVSRRADGEPARAATTVAS